MNDLLKKSPVDSAVRILLEVSGRDVEGAVSRTAAGVIASSQQSCRCPGGRRGQHDVSFWAPVGDDGVAEKVLPVPAGASTKKTLPLPALFLMGEALVMALRAAVCAWFECVDVAWQGWRRAAAAASASRGRRRVSRVLPGPDSADPPRL